MKFEGLLVGWFVLLVSPLAVRGSSASCILEGSQSEGSVMILGGFVGKSPGSSSQLVFVDVIVDDSEYPNGDFVLSCLKRPVGALSVYGLDANQPLRFEISKTVGHRQCVSNAIKKHCFTLTHDGRNRDIESVQLVADNEMSRTRLRRS